MKKTTSIGTALCVGYLAAAVPQSVQPLKASTGLWQMTVTTTWTGLPPEMANMMANGRTRSYTSCVKPEDLRSNPWGRGDREQCTWTVLASTETDMDLKGTSCNIGMQGMTADILGKIHLSDEKNGTGSFDVSLSSHGQTAMGHASYTGKWVSSTCPTE